MNPDRSRTHVVCLPFAGAGASFFRPWAAAAGPDLVVVPLQLPGRERLVDEEPYRTVPEAVDGLLAQLRETLDAGAGRLILFGHSLGAVLAYELGHRLASGAGPRPRRLYVSGSPQPRAGRVQRATGLPDEEFLARVGEFAGYRHSALRDPEMRELILPALRADVEMHENYVPGHRAPLDVPLTSLRGAADTLVSADEARAWSKATSRAFEYVEMPGGHMYLTDAAPSLLRLVRSDAAEGE